MENMVVPQGYIIGLTMRTSRQLHQDHRPYQSTEYVRCLMKKVALEQEYGAPTLCGLRTKVSTWGRTSSRRDGIRWHTVRVGRYPCWDNTWTRIVTDHAHGRAFQSISFVIDPSETVFQSLHLNSTSFAICTVRMIATTQGRRC